MRLVACVTVCVIPVVANAAQTESWPSFDPPAYCVNRGADFYRYAPRKTPGGGPKPDKLMRDALALELHQEVKLTSGEKVKKLRLVARTLVDNAIDGDTTAARECFDRMDGKVTQGVDAVPGDITVTWVRPAY